MKLYLSSVKVEDEDIKVQDQERPYSVNIKASIEFESHGDFSKLSKMDKAERRVWIEERFRKHIENRLDFFEIE